MTYRILVTGARSCTERQALYVENVIYAAAYTPMSRGESVTVVQGECPYGGVDKVAENLSTSTKGLINEGHPANWDHLGSKAGPARNAEMVTAGADICLAFPNAQSTGTWDCIRKAAAAGIHVRIYPLVES
jgi:hypothetical protein